MCQLLLFIATFSAVGPYLVHDPVNLPVLSVNLLAHVQSHVAQVSYDPTHLLQVFIHLVLPGIVCYPIDTEGKRNGLKMGREQSMQIETCTLAHTIYTPYKPDMTQPCTSSITTTQQFQRHIQYKHTLCHTHTHITTHLPADKSPTDGHLFTLVHDTGSRLTAHHSVCVAAPCLAPSLYPASQYISVRVCVCAIHNLHGVIKGV